MAKPRKAKDPQREEVGSPSNDVAARPPLAVRFLQRARQFISDRAIRLAAELIVLAGVVVYANSFSGVLIYDDASSIKQNPSIRRLGQLGQVLSPPCNGETVSGRPLLNLSFAINYAVSGTAVWSYHAVNLAIHIVNALLLFGILRRTFQMPCLRQALGDATLPLALAASLLWTVHPLQTESVTYIVQRAESLGGFFYLFTLYLVIRGSDSPRAPAWHAGAVLSCLLGMATKEIMVTAPVVVLLYDRTFLAGSFREALRRRWGLYLGLAATWILLTCLVVSTGLLSRGEEMRTPDRWSYAWSQPGILWLYLRLAFWPHPLCLDYGFAPAHAWRAILPATLGIGVLVATTIWGLVGGRKWGFLGAWFFLILAPTSGVIPLGQLAFEHRMYLSLAAVTTAVVLVVLALGQAVVRREWLTPLVARVLAGCLVAAGVLALAVVTCRRNADYHSEEGLWGDTLAKAPHNARAYNNLGSIIAVQQGPNAGVPYFEKAVELDPLYAHAHNNLGVARKCQGRLDEAVAHCRRAVAINPSYLSAYFNLGNTLCLKGSIDEAIVCLRKVLEIDPRHCDALNSLGEAYCRQGKWDEGMACFREALEINPNPDSYNELAKALYHLGKRSEAISCCLKAIELGPQSADACNRLAEALEQVGRWEEALATYRKAIEIDPHHAGAHHNLGVALGNQGRLDEAIDCYWKSLEINPNSAETHYNLGIALGRQGKAEEAIAHYEKAVALKPADARFQFNLAVTRGQQGRLDEAIAHYRKALQINPRHAEALNNLSVALCQQGKTEEAMACWEKTLQVNPRHAGAHQNLGIALHQQGRTREALVHWREGLRLQPEVVPILNLAAWVLATHPDASLRNASEAIELAERAVRLSGGRNPVPLDTLAAAYAEAGRFPDAERTARQAADLAAAAGNTALAEAVKARLALYQAGSAFRDTPRGAPTPPRP